MLPRGKNVFFAIWALPGRWSNVGLNKSSIPEAMYQRGTPRLFFGICFWQRVPHPKPGPHQETYFPTPLLWAVSLSHLHPGTQRQHIRCLLLVQAPERPCRAGEWWMHLTKKTGGRLRANNVFFQGLQKINNMYDIKVSFSNCSTTIVPQFADVWFEFDIHITSLGLCTAFHLLCQVNLSRDFEKWPWAWLLHNGRAGADGSDCRDQSWIRIDKMFTNCDCCGTGDNNFIDDDDDDEWW